MVSTHQAIDVDIYELYYIQERLDFAPQMVDAMLIENTKHIQLLKYLP